MNDLCIRGRGESSIVGKRMQENFCFATTKSFFSRHGREGFWDKGVKGLWG